MAVSSTQIPAALGDRHTLEGRDSLVSLACPPGSSMEPGRLAWRPRRRQEGNPHPPHPHPPLPRVLPLLTRAQQAARCGDPSTGPDTTGPGCGPQSVERPWPAHSPFWSSTAPSTQPKNQAQPSDLPQRCAEETLTQGRSSPPVTETEVSRAPERPPPPKGARVARSLWMFNLLPSGTLAKNRWQEKTALSKPKGEGFPSV